MTIEETEHQKFKALLKRLNLTYRDLADILEMSYDSVKSQLAPSKKLPKWAKTMLLVAQGLQ